jgi:hypothetical protein
MLTPSPLFHEAWNNPDFKSYYTIILNNLFEDSEEERKQLTSLTAPESSLAHLPKFYNYTQDQWTGSGRYHYLWNITQRELQSELDRVLTEEVSLVFVLNWLKYKSKKSELRSFIQDNSLLNTR